MSAVVDHMWQTLQVIACLAFFALLTRRNSARFRIWLWRAAAVKLVLPLHVLYAAGEWISFPVTHSAEPPPAWLLRLAGDLEPWFAPAERWTAPLRWLTFAGLLLVLAGAAWLIRRELLAEKLRVARELERLEKDPDDHPRGLGLLNAAFVSAWALLLLSGPMLSGAIDDRLRRQALLHRNELGLETATVAIRPAEPGMGSRYRVIADDDGVTIRNATLQEIGGLAYGVSVYLVRGQHFAKEGEEDWLTGSRHDVRIDGPVIDPEHFDPYALREPLTRTLATKYGLEIYRNGKCMPPCGRWSSFELPPAARAAIEAGLVPDDEAPAKPAVAPPVRSRFDAYLRAFNSGDRLELAEFHREHLNGYSQTAMSIDEELMLQKNFGGFDVLEFTEVRPRVASGWVRGRDSDALMAFHFEMESVEPFRISQRNFSWGSPPKHYFPRRLGEADAVRAFEAQLRKQARADRFSGAALVTRGDRVLLRRAHGLADRENGIPNEPDTRFRIASVTKMFTAVAVLRLVQERKVRLDDPIGKWVSEVSGKPLAHATIHQLLTHTSGAGEIFNSEYQQSHLDLRSHSDYVRLFA